MIKRGFFTQKRQIIIIALFLIIASFFVEGANVTTTANVTNSPPTLIKLIPNQSWKENSSNLNAFDLDDYFFDYNLDALTYTFQAVENISIVLDLENSVSFFPDPGFRGTRNTTFVASDGYDNTTSNIVFLIVGLDIEPPKWVSVSKSKSKIYQNDYVNFSAVWTDNFQLQGFIFSIKQGTSWVNYSEQNMSGTQNTSKQEIQISASGGSVVFWRFYAYDTSGNINATPIQNFSVSSFPSYSPPVSPSGGGTGTGGQGTAQGGILRGFFKKQKQLEDFSIEPELIEIEAKQGDLVSKAIKITNTGTKNLTFNFYQRNLDKVIIFDKEPFTLEPGKSKEIALDFKIPRTLKPDLYFGYFIVNSTTSKKVTILLNVKALNPDFDVDVLIPIKYKTVKPGKKVKANVTIESLGNIVNGNGTLYIAIRDLGGNIYAFSEQEIEFFQKQFFEKELQVPEKALAGDYIFYARFFAYNQTAIGSDSFQVGIRYNILAFIKSSFMLLLLLILAIILAILMHRYNLYRERERALRLYLMLTRLQKLLEEKKYDEALNLYIELKAIYKEKIPEDIKEDKEKLRQEIQKLSEKLNRKKIKEQEEVNGKEGKDAEDIKEGAGSSKTINKEKTSSNEGNNKDKTIEESNSNKKSANGKKSSESKKNNPINKEKDSTDKGDNKPSSEEPKSKNGK